MRQQQLDAAGQQAGAPGHQFRQAGYGNVMAQHPPHPGLPPAADPSQHQAPLQEQSQGQHRTGEQRPAQQSSYNFV